LGDDQDHHILINLIKQCLEAMSQDIHALNKLDLEIYYKLIKNLTKRIHRNHEQAFREYDDKKAERRRIRPDIENSDESDNDALPHDDHVISSQFQNLRLRSKSH
jgi:hypothetical protein